MARVMSYHEQFIADLETPDPGARFIPILRTMKDEGISRVEAYNTLLAMLDYVRSKNWEDPERIEDIVINALDIVSLECARECHIWTSY
jgi:hypothetical protein